MSIDEVNAVATPLIRKYDWYTAQVDEKTVKLTITDGQKDASVDITTGESIEGEIERLIKAVDAHEYTVIG